MTRKARVTTAAIAVLLAGATAAAAQAVPSVLGGIDVYRATSLTREQLISAHGALLDSIVAVYGRGDMNAVLPYHQQLVTSLRARRNLVHVDINITTSFEANRNVLFLMVDVVERADSASRLAFARAPRGQSVDPLGALEKWQEYEQRATALVQSRQLSPQLDTCPVLHCWLGFEHPQLQPYRAVFDQAASQHHAALIEVLRSDARAERRAAAVFVLAHLNDPLNLVRTLRPALRDPNNTVRNNALRVLMQIAQRHTNVGMPIQDILRALDDPSSAARNKAAETVSLLAARPNYRAAILEQGDAVLRLLRLRLDNNRDPAHRILRALSGRNYAVTDLAAWEAWLRQARGK